jgi:hypothetical protein
MTEWKTYGGRLSWAMRHAGKTNQSELARAIGVKPQSIQYLCGPESGAQGSVHTPALAKALRVSPDWLARGEGQPADLASSALGTAEASMATYIVAPVTRAQVMGSFKVSGAGDIEAVSATRAEGQVQAPALSQLARAVRIKGNALSPYVKDGQYLLLQPAGDDLMPEDNIVITLADGRMLIRELMYKRADSLVVLPVHGGQPEAIEAGDIQRIDAVLCVVPRRWWQADTAGQ